jgi:hypothetical protein
MKQQGPVEPLRGEGAFRAHKAEIARRNERACAEGAVERAAWEARISERALAAERLERSRLPHQPRP